MTLFELGDLLVCHLHVRLVIHFVSEHHYLHVTARVLIDLTKPDRYAEETLAIGEVEDDDDAVSTLVIGVRNCAVPFLACRVPDLQLDRALVYLQRSEPEVDSDRADVVLLEAVILLTVKLSASSLWNLPRT